MSEKKPKPATKKSQPSEKEKPKSAAKAEPAGEAEGEAPEPDFTADLDGDMTLDETRSRCEVEQDGGFQLRGIKFKTLTAGSTVLLVNKADFMDKPIGRLKHLRFEPVGTKDPAQLKKQIVEAEKWTFICDSQIYVKQNVTRVMVFGKRKL